VRAARDGKTATVTGQGRRLPPLALGRAAVRARSRSLVRSALWMGMIFLAGCSGAALPVPGAARPDAARAPLPAATGAVPAPSPPISPATPPPRGPAAPVLPGPAPARALGRAGIPAWGHIFLIVLENLGYDQAVQLPYASSLAARFASATQYSAAAHPSLPNYLALTSGNTWVHSDCLTCSVDAPNLGSEASAAGISWGAYMEGLPSTCWLGAFDLSTDYAGKHDPFRYYTDIRSSPALCGHIQPLTALAALLDAPGAAEAVPRLVWITPDLCHDGHDCSPATADRWLQAFVPQILASPAWRQGGVLFITWDEGNGDDSSGCCGAVPGGGHVLTLVVAPGLPAGQRVAVPYNHYSLLATVEDALGLPLLGHAADPQTRPLSAFWAPAPGG
jgi:hypothetical protein